MFGRDYDTKYVVARSWSAFLALVADDLNSGKWFVDEDTNELKLREFKTTRVEPGYFEILRWRMDQKYGRRAPNKRKSVVPNGAGSPAGSGSPYSSPTEPNGEVRGRSMNRLQGTSPLISPIRLGAGASYGRSSPLARVTEEAGSSQQPKANGTKVQKLVEVETPRPSEDGGTPRLAALTRGDSANVKGKENAIPSVIKTNGKQPEMDGEAMTPIEI